MVKDDRHSVLEASLRLPKGTELCCPKCDNKTDKVYDHQTYRLRDMDWRTYEMYLNVEVPRIKCPEHGVIQSSSPFTL